MGLRNGVNQEVARSITFVALSLGGLVCAEIACRPQDTMLGRLKRTDFMNGGRRIGFPGTSHQGSDNGKWVTLGKNFRSIFSQDTNADILKELEQGSETSVKLGGYIPQMTFTLGRESEGPG